MLSLGGKLIRHSSASMYSRLSASERFCLSKCQLPALRLPLFFIHMPCFTSKLISTGRIRPGGRMKTVCHRQRGESDIKEQHVLHEIHGVLERMGDGERDKRRNNCWWRYTDELCSVCGIIDDTWLGGMAVYTRLSSPATADGLEGLKLD